MTICMCVQLCLWHLLSFTIIDINEFYTYTLEDPSKPIGVKTEATFQLAERWENVSPPVPADTMDMAKRTLDDEVNNSC